MTIRGRTLAPSFLKIETLLVLDPLLECCFELGCRMLPLLETLAAAFSFLRRSWWMENSAGYMWSGT
jgi:hypothetical protein